MATRLPVARGRVARVRVESAMARDRHQLDGAGATPVVAPEKDFTADVDAILQFPERYPDAVVRIGDGNYFGGVHISCVGKIEIGDNNLLGNTVIRSWHNMVDTNLWRLRAYSDDVLSLTASMRRLALSQRRPIVGTITASGISFAYVSGTAISSRMPNQ